jgi:SAM-dependent methyltransferase
LIVQLVSEITHPGDRLLEIGCGTGYVLQALDRECGLRVTGTELHAEGLVHARQRVPHAELVQLDARAMPYESAFDLVAAFDVLEHIDDDLRALRGLYRATRPGGFLLATVPQHMWLWSQADVAAQHVRRYRRHELVGRARAAGFTPVRATSFVSVPLPAMAVARARDRLGRREFDPLADLTPPRFVNRMLERILDLERLLIARGVDLPVGGSLVLVAQRERR